MKKFEPLIVLLVVVLLGIAVFAILNLYNSGGKKEVVKKEVVKNEKWYNARFCESVGGETENRLNYEYPDGKSYVKVDCETDTTVWEGGLDKRWSLDSIQQALFFASISGKQPGVVIYDTDGEFGMYEHRIKEACQLAEVTFRRELIP